LYIKSQILFIIIRMSYQILKYLWRNPKISAGSGIRTHQVHLEVLTFIITVVNISQIYNKKLLNIEYNN